MANGPGLLETFRDLAGSRADDRPDCELLRRFVATRDAEAFAALVRRHGPLVWGVCRRVLRREHDAEDAFQATFLVLARSAASIHRRASLRSWMYGVALRIARRARLRNEQLAPSRETLTPVPAADSRSAVDRAELITLVDQEIARLPEHYRLPVVLCYLLGWTNDAAALELGCPRGTVAVRLARARVRLRRRLERLGLGPAAGVPALPLTGVLPRALVSETCQSACSLTSRRPRSSTGSVLANGELKSMFLNKCKALILASLTIGLLGVVGIGSRTLFAQAPAASGVEFTAAPVPEPEKPKTPGEQRLAARIHDLLTERLRSAKLELTEREDQFIAGRGVLDLVLGASGRVLRSDLELATSKERRLAAHEAHIERLKKYLDINQARFNAGRASVGDLEMTRYFYLDARIELERERER
jgi:RNA polymerase sigma factor (sigma-70 family)